MAEKRDVKGEQKGTRNENIPERTTEITTVKQSSTPWPLITIGIIVTGIVMILIFAGWWFMVMHSDRIGSGSSNGLLGRNFDDGSRMFNRGGGDFGGRRGYMNAVSGVVTSIDGDTFKVAGNGKEVTIKKTSTTTITGDKTDIAVNDSVIIIGSANSDSTVTATRIIVRNIDASDMSTMPGA